MCIEIIETIGTSKKSWKGAVSDSFSRYQDKNVTGIDVLGFTAEVNDGKVVEYRANVKLAYKIKFTVFLKRD